MKNLKKVLILALVLALAVSMFAACGNDEEEQPGDVQGGADKTVYNVGLVQFAPHPALDAATDGFKAALEEKLGTDNVKFNYQNAAGEPSTCPTIVNQFISSGVDLIFANATPALQAAVAGTVDIPIVATAITSYEVALDEDDWANRTTGKNVTGTADLAPLAEQAAMFKELLPDIENIGLLYCSGEPNSKYQVDVIAGELAKLGYTTTMYTFSDSNDIASVVTTACKNSDALYIPTDNAAASNTEIIANIADPANVPIIAGEEGICEGCGIATLSISYYDIGHVAGEMAYEILVNGADPSTMEIAYADNLTKKYDAARIAKYGITPPADYVALGE